MADAVPRTRWLDEEEQQHWRAYLRGSRLIETFLDRDLQQHGISLSEYEIISMLSEARDRHLRMSEIADLVVQSRSRLTHTASRLERRGWVLRQPCADDRRGVELVLTAEGQAAIQDMAPRHIASVREHFIDFLTPAEFAALGEAMSLVRTGLGGETLGYDAAAGGPAARAGGCGTQPEAGPHAEPATQPDAQPATSPEAGPHAEPATQPDTPPDTPPATQLDTPPDTPPDTGRDTEPAPGAVG